MMTFKMGYSKEDEEEMLSHLRHRRNKMPAIITDYSQGHADGYASGYEAGKLVGIQEGVEQAAGACDVLTVPLAEGDLTEREIGYWNGISDCMAAIVALAAPP